MALISALPTSSCWDLEPRSLLYTLETSEVVLWDAYPWTALDFNPNMLELHSEGQTSFRLCSHWRNHITTWKEARFPSSSYTTKIQSHKTIDSSNSTPERKLRPTTLCAIKWMPYYGWGKQENGAPILPVGHYISGSAIRQPALMPVNGLVLLKVALHCPNSCPLCLGCF